MLLLRRAPMFGVAVMLGVAATLAVAATLGVATFGIAAMLAAVALPAGVRVVEPEPPWLKPAARLAPVGADRTSIPRRRGATLGVVHAKMARAVAMHALRVV